MSLCIVLSIALSGIVRVIAGPAASPALADLPQAVVIVVDGAWIIAGASTATGILVGRRNLESAGLILLATSLIGYFLAIIAFKPSAALASLYVLGLAIGAGLRAHYVTGASILILPDPRPK